MKDIIFSAYRYELMNVVFIAKSLKTSFADNLNLISLDLNCTVSELVYYSVNTQYKHKLNKYV